MKIKYEKELLELAGEDITLEEMVNEAVRRFIEYSKEENIVKYFRCPNDEMLLGYEDANY